MPSDSPARTLTSDDGFEIVSHETLQTATSTMLDNRPDGSVDNRERNDNDVSNEDGNFQSRTQPGPLSLSGHQAPGEDYPEGNRLMRKLSNGHPTPSLDQIRSSMLSSLNAFDPKDMVERLVNLLAENRRQRDTMRLQSDSLQKAVEAILQLRQDKKTMETKDKENFAKAKKKIEKLKDESVQLATQLQAKEEEVRSLNQFRVSSAQYQQQLTELRSQVVSRESEFKAKEEELKEAKEKLRNLTTAPRRSDSEEPTSVEPDMFLDLMDKRNQLEIEKQTLTSDLKAARKCVTEQRLEIDNRRQAELTMETEMIGLRDTIMEHRREITQLKRQHDNLLEDSNVKDLMDGAQKVMASEPKKGDESDSNDNSSYGFVSTVQDTTNTQDLNEELEQVLKQLNESKTIEQDLKNQLQSIEKKNHQSLQQHSSEMKALKAQVVCLVGEVEKLRAQKEMEESKSAAEINGLRHELELQMGRFAAASDEASAAQALIRELQSTLESYKKDADEKASLIRFFESQNDGSGDADQRLLFKEQEVNKLRLEVDRLTAQYLAAEDAINVKDSQLSHERKEYGKLRSKLDDVGMLQAQAQVYKEDFNQEKQAREKIAIEKERLVVENHQLIDQIAHLNEILQTNGAPQFSRYPTPSAQQPQRNSLYATMPRSRSHQSSMGQGQSSPNRQYTLADREAASIQGRQPAYNPTVCPFSGADMSNGAFAMNPVRGGSPRVQIDGSSPSFSDVGFQGVDDGPNRSPTPDRQRRSSGWTAGSPQLGVLTPKSPRRSPSRTSSSPMGMPTSPPPRAPSTILSASPLEVEDDWQLYRESRDLACPKCHVRVASVDLLQMHVLECLDA